jgi:hypothetical protein
MTIAKIGKKFPWWSIPLIILVIVLGAIVLGMLVPSFATWAIAGLASIGVFLWGLFISCITSLYFWAGFGIMGVAFFIYFYRKNYSKQKVLLSTTAGSSLPAVDRLAAPLFDEDTKVEQA